MRFFQLIILFISFLLLSQNQLKSDNANAWIEIFPMGGLLQKDFFVANFSDFNKKQIGPPSKVEAASFNQGIKDLKASKQSNMLKALKKIYYYNKNDNCFHLKKNASEYDKALAKVVFLGFILTGFKWDAPSDLSEVLLDYDGGTKTYDGHPSIDYFISNFVKQERGIPVYAVADGTVTHAYSNSEIRLGQPVHNSSVVLSHKNGYTSYYWHMENPLPVKLGDKIRAGQQIGWVTGDSKSYSYQAHLDFSISEKPNGERIEPHSGKVNTIPSRFKKQPEYFKISSGIINWAFLTKGVDRRQSFYRIGDKNTALWILLINYKPETIIRWDLFNPQGVQTVSNYKYPLKIDSHWALGQAFSLYHNINTKGIWNLKIYLDDILIKSITFNAVGRKDKPPANRKPDAPDSIKLSVIPTTNHDVYLCKTSESVKNLDPDLQRPVFWYRWKIEGKIVRDIKTIARSDLIPQIYGKKGNIIECIVKVFDGKFYSKSVFVSDIISR